MMYNYVDSSDYPFTSYIFFSLLVIFGSFFAINLILAQIIDSYTEQQFLIEERNKEVRRIKEQ